MSKASLKTKIILGIILVFALLQLIPSQQINEVIEPQNDFLSQVEAPTEVKVMIQSSCYDCHSNQPSYPWYAQVAPLSWWIDHHIEEGREHLNFSEWSTYSAEKKEHKLEECWEEIEEGEMPLYSYTIMHSDAQFSDEQLAQLIQFFKTQAAE